MPATACRTGAAILVVAALLSGCAAAKPQADGSVRYRYSAFDFSGDAWKAQQQRCAPAGKKPQDLGTECGFWTCVSLLGCT